jgi:hypothetical protein
MREVMKSLEDKQIRLWEAVYVEKRKKPLYYKMVFNETPVIVLGHYEAACGGGDTIGSAPKIYKLTEELSEKYKSYTGKLPIILWEALIPSEDVIWTVKTLEWDTPIVYYLTTSLDTCFEQIKQRRLLEGNTKEVDRYKTSTRMPSIERSRVRLLEQGVKCVRCSSNQASKLILKEIQNESRINLD